MGRRRMRRRKRVRAGRPRGKTGKDVFGERGTPGGTSFFHGAASHFASRIDTVVVRVTIAFAVSADNPL
jgi:hypothetical protein